MPLSWGGVGTRVERVWVGHRQLSQDSNPKLDLTAGRFWGQSEGVTYLLALSPGPYQQGGGVGEVT